MIRRKKVYTYVIAGFLVSLVWFVASRSSSVRSFRASNNDARGFENIYPGENSFGVQNHAGYPTKRPTKATPVLSSQARHDTDMLVSEDTVASALRVPDRVRNVEYEATGLLKQHDRTPDIINRSPNTSTWQANKKQWTASRERNTDTTSSTKYAHYTHVTRASNVAPQRRKLTRGITTVGHHDESMHSRPKQLNASAIRTTESMVTKNGPEAVQIARVYQKINLNKDNSQIFSNSSLPAKQIASGTRKKLVSYPTKVPRKDVDAMFRARAVEDAMYRKRETDLVRDDIMVTTLRIPSSSVDKAHIGSIRIRSKQLISSAARIAESTPTKSVKNQEAEQIAKVYEKLDLNVDNSRAFPKVSLPSKQNTNGTSENLVSYPTKVPRKDVDAMFRARAAEDAAIRARATTLVRDGITITTLRVASSLVDTYPNRSTHRRSKQFISSATRTTETTPTKLQQFDKQRDAETEQFAQVYEHMNLNADNSRAFSKLSLPSKRNGNGTSTNLMEYPTKVHRKDIETVHEPSYLPDKVQQYGPTDKGTSHHLGGENVVSMSVYGSERRYTVGVMRNAEMIRENFPGWKLRVYTEVPSEKPRYGVLPQVS